MFLALFCIGIAEFDKVICTCPYSDEKEADDDTVLETCEFKAVNVDDAAEKRCNPTVGEKLNSVDNACCEKVGC